MAKKLRKSKKRNLKRSFQRIVTGTLVTAGLSTYASMSIVGGCVPADCGGPYDTEATLDETIHTDQQASLDEFVAENPDATARQKLEHLYGSSTAPGPFAGQGMSLVALDLLIEDAAQNPDGLDLYLCQQVCSSPSVEGCHVGESTAPDPIRPETLYCERFEECIGGREPAGLLSDGLVASADLRGAYWAYLCHLEGAAVHAFKALYEELGHHGAPPRLLRGIARAVLDEIHHVELTRRMAERFGATPVEPRIETVPIRSLEAIALENAREGCVREAFGALDMEYQAQTTEDDEMRAVFARIANDEAFHAELSWELDEWLCEQLPHDARLRVAQAKLDALEQLKRDVGRRDTRDTIYESMADSHTASLLLDGLGAELGIS